MIGEREVRTKRTRNRIRAGERAERLARVGGAVQPVALAHERLLPASAGVAPLLPDGGLRRGSTIAVAGSTSLALALAAGPSAAGSWCAAIGAPGLGLVAAEELGIALERFPLIAASGKSWARAVATALEAFDLVLAWPPRGVPAGEARRLSALGRERGAVFVLCGPGWPERTDLRLEAVRSEWVGLERGHGRLRARRLEVEVGGRGAASAGTRMALWLPAVDGGVAVAPAIDDADGIARGAASAGAAASAGVAGFAAIDAGQGAPRSLARATG